MNNDKFVRISQLPESTKINNTDYLVTENTEDTWKVRFSVFDDYISSLVGDKVDNDITGVVDQKISEIQIQINNTEEIITALDQKVIDFTKAEDIRKKQEDERIQNETARQTTYDENNQLVNQWIEDERARKTAEAARVTEENKRKTAETDRASAEAARVTEENKRKTAENNRAANETARQTAETTRASAEAARVTAETGRVNSFNSMSSYFNNIKAALDNCIYEGQSNLTAANKITNIISVMLPKENHGYEALIHICQGSVNTFLAVSFTFNYNSSKAITGGTASVLVPEKFSSSLNSNEIYVGWKMDGTDHVHVICQYRGRVSGVITTAIMWDNITTYKPTTDTQIYAKAVKNQNTGANFSTNYAAFSITMAKATVKNLPQGFINIFDSIESQIQDMINAIKPYKMWPVGTVYATTSTSNPRTILGGGDWTALYSGAGISEGIMLKNGTQYNSPKIYYWVRTA